MFNLLSVKSDDILENRIKTFLGTIEEANTFLASCKEYLIRDFNLVSLRTDLKVAICLEKFDSVCSLDMQDKDAKYTYKHQQFVYIEPNAGNLSHVIDNMVYLPYAIKAVDIRQNVKFVCLYNVFMKEPLIKETKIDEIKKEEVRFVEAPKVEESKQEELTKPSEQSNEQWNKKRRK